MVTADEHDLAPQAPDRLKLSERAWCALMLLVVFVSTAIAIIVIANAMRPEGGPVLRLELVDLVPQPGFRRLAHIIQRDGGIACAVSESTRA